MMNANDRKRARYVATILVGAAQQTIAMNERDDRCAIKKFGIVYRYHGKCSNAWLFQEVQICFMTIFCEECKLVRVLISKITLKPNSDVVMSYIQSRSSTACKIQDPGLSPRHTCVSSISSSWDYKQNVSCTFGMFHQ